MAGGGVGFHPQTQGVSACSCPARTLVSGTSLPTLSPQLSSAHRITELHAFSSRLLAKHIGFQILLFLQDKSPWLASTIAATGPLRG